MSYYQVRGSALRRATRTLPPRRPWRLRAAGVAGARSQKTGDARQPRPWRYAPQARPRAIRDTGRATALSPPQTAVGVLGLACRDRGALPQYRALNAF